MYKYNVTVVSHLRELCYLESDTELTEDEIRAKWSGTEPILSEVTDVQDIEIEEV